jgi:hypothetical protein
MKRVADLWKSGSKAKVVIGCAVVAGLMIACIACFLTASLLDSAADETPSEITVVVTATSAFGTIPGQADEPTREPRDTDTPEATSTPSATDTPTLAPTPAPTATPSRTHTPLPSPTPFPTATPDWVAPPFDELCERDTSLTDAQQEKALEEHVGKKVVQWQGWVSEVREGFSDYWVLVAMEPPGGLLWVRDIRIVGVPEDRALSLNKKQKVTFSGTIRGIGTFLGSICNPVVIGDATIE